jgi:hypothetical protein
MVRSPAVKLVRIVGSLLRATAVLAGCGGGPSADGDSGAAPTWLRALPRNSTTLSIADYAAVDPNVDGDLVRPTDRFSSLVCGGAFHTFALTSGNDARAKLLEAAGGDLIGDAQVEASGRVLTVRLESVDQSILARHIVWDGALFPPLTN